MRKEIQKLFGNGEFQKFSEEQKNDKFQEMFHRLKEEAAQEHPPTGKTVERCVRKMFELHQLPWTPTTEGRTGWDKIWKTFTDLASRLKMGFQKFYQGKLDEEKMVAKIMRMVMVKLMVVKKYSDDVVLNSLQLVAKELQDTWDKENCASVRFAACEADMRSYFNSLGLGMQGQELLVKMLQDHFDRNIKEGFEQEMAVVVGTRLKQARWVADPEVMQAYIDRDLLRMMDFDVSSMLSAINGSVEHFGKVTEALVEHAISQVIHEKFTSFKESLKRGIHIAAVKASQVQFGRAKLFLAALRTELREGLTSTNSCLVDKLPVYDSNYDCDGQAPRIFTTDTPSIPGEIVKFIPNQYAYTSGSLVKRILVYMQSRAYGAHDGIRPRCGAACPMCSCTCIQAVGHDGDPLDKLHDTYHQPLGLSGRRVLSSNELSAGSCGFCVENNWRFLHQDEWVPFKEFNRVFPDWAMPIVRRPLALREYILKNYQEELVRLYPGSLDCSDIPGSYNHNLSSIKHEIESIIADG
ncbi:hypothetical protein R1sor_011452 [Riccia sorocarpa]|uniref:Uncharacterized protein n=1 Tax=Riccia sorocarpa TaxID=122646 RepID=A0ABD3I557_9MARC